MKLISTDKMLFGLIVLTLSAGLVGTQYASAESPDTQPDPGLIPIGGTFDLTWVGNGLTDPHDVRLIRVHEPTVVNLPDGDTDAGSNGIGNCVDKIDKATMAGDARMWELRHVDNSQPVQFSGIDAGEKVRVKFGVNGAAVNIVKDAGVTTSSLTGKWVQITPGETDADFIDVVGNWKMESCGADFVGMVPPGSWRDEDGILVVQPVGGEILSLDTSALLIAGLTTSGIWMIPTFGAIAGTGITLFKLRKNI